MKLGFSVRCVRVVCLIVVTTILGSAPAQAIVIRHDRDDSAHRALGNRHPEAVSILPDGTGVLVAPEWVLTAAHVARGVANRNSSVEVSGREIGIARIFLHPKWKDMGAHDVALLKLAEPVTDVAPASLYAGDDEVGRVATFVGRGDFGTGLTGPETMDRVKRGATNRVDGADDDWLYFTFEQGDAGTELEGVSGPGDSGGPALLTVDGTTYTLGVSVFSDGGGGGPGRYGIREGYTRVSTHRDWIDGVLAGTSGDRGMAPGEAPRRMRRAGTHAMSMGEGSAELPDNPVGKLVASYLEAYNSNDNEKMKRYIAGHFTETLREKRTEAEHIDLYRRLYDELFGGLAVSRVMDVAGDGMTVLLDGATGKTAEIRFAVDSGDEPKISAMQIALVDVAVR